MEMLIQLFKCIGTVFSMKEKNRTDKDQIYKEMRMSPNSYLNFLFNELIICQRHLTSSVSLKSNTYLK